ncbi:MAG TPA: cell surface protein SprA, partial [Gemmatimonadaceae bacterium]|nr:cell surface protein SprA [Gemmatimonadaceae bacterium]
TALGQRQRSSFTRPPLGFEPAGALLAGVGADLAWDAPGISRFVRSLPGAGADTLRSTAPARVTVQGEFATSRPWNDSDMQAYLESFEGAGGIQPSLSEVQWYLSSLPASSPALDAAAGAGTLGLDRAATLAWQSNGRTAGGQLVTVTRDQIDPGTESVGSGFFLPETVLWLTMHPLRVGGFFREGLLISPRWIVNGAPTGRRWRSLRTRLGATGADLTRVEAVEFWTLADLGPSRGGHNPTLVLDFGDVSENTVSVAPESLFVSSSGADTVYRGRRIVRLDTLDTELDPFTRTFDQARDDHGLPGDVSGPLTIVSAEGVRDTAGVILCRRGTQQVFRLGDPLASCTAANNRADTEDLNDDGVLNLDESQRQQERIRRYVVRVDDPSRRARVGRCGVVVESDGGAPSRNLCWVLVRVPWQAPDDSLNGGPPLRRVRALRITVVSGVDQDAEAVQLPITALRLVGAPWTKRDDRVARGLAGNATGAGTVVATLVGTQDRDAAGLQYEPPPGVAITGETRLTGAEGERRIVTESSLRLLATQLAPYERAEAFFRFPEGARSALAYRELRLWARGRGAGWGPGGALQMFVKLGRDGDNFYLYRTGAQSGTGVAAWEPEVRVDLRRFSRLRGRLQQAFLANGPNVQCTGLDSALVAATPPLDGARGGTWAACEDGYMVVTADPLALAPNLAAVQELAVGIVRVDDGSVPLPAGDTLELWVNELRLASVNRTPGYAGQLDVAIDAGPLGGLRVVAGRRDPYFRQLAEAPSFLTDDAVELSATVNAERLLPASLGLAFPITMRVGRTATDPLLVSGADYEADQVPGLRTPATSATSLSATLRRRTRGTGPLAPVLDGLSITGTYATANSRGEFLSATVRDAAVGAAWEQAAAPRRGLLPGWLRDIIARLPNWMERGSGLRALRETPVRWNPTRVRVATGIAHARDRRTAYLLPAESVPSDGRDVGALSRYWRNEALVEMRPWTPLTLRWDVRQVRDLRHYDDTSAVSRSLEAARGRLLGIDAGIERERSMGALVDLRPTSGWVRPRVTLAGRYDALRDPNRQLFVLDADGDSTVPRRLGSSQSVETGVTVDIAQRLTDRKATGTLAALGRRLLPVDVSWTRNLRSAFDATTADPSLAWQLGWGGEDAFRQLQGDAASYAAQSAQLAATTGVTLPYGAVVTVRYASGHGRNFTRQALPEQRVDEADQVTFPDVALRWSWRPAASGGNAVVRALMLDARWLLTRQVGVARADAAALRETRVSRAEGYPLALTVTWAPGELTTRVAWTRGDRVDSLPGSEIHSRTDELSADVGRSFPLPASWNLRSGLRTRAGLQHTR